MGGLIDMERKGCESIGCYTHIVTLNFDLTHDQSGTKPNLVAKILATNLWA